MMSPEWPLALLLTPCVTLDKSLPSLDLRLIKNWTLLAFSGAHGLNDFPQRGGLLCSTLPQTPPLSIVLHRASHPLPQPVGSLEASECVISERLSFRRSEL